MDDDFQAIADDLFAATGASRTTIRLDRPDAVFPVVAEALAPGVNSLIGPSSIDLKAAATFKYLDETHGELIQNDFLDVEHPPPAELIQLYGARAQMLHAVVKDGKLAGIISVHYSEGPREWTEAEIAALREAARRTEALL